jgi:outer membrane protein OmpA-like peptidoglycan-associated protein
MTRHTHFTGIFYLLLRFGIVALCSFVFLPVAFSQAASAPITTGSQTKPTTTTTDYKPAYEKIKVTPTPAPMPDWASEKLTTESIELHRGEPGVVRITWTTQSEEDNFGFNVMRGDNKEGTNFKAANKKVILGAGNSSTENKYVFYDTDVKVGDSYFYYLEEIDINGNRKIFSPVWPRTVQYRNLKALKERTAPSIDATTHALQPVLKTVQEAEASTQGLERQIAAAASPVATASATPVPAASPTPAEKSLATLKPSPSRITPSPSPSPAHSLSPTPVSTPEPMNVPKIQPQPVQSINTSEPSENKINVHFAKASDGLTSEAQTKLAKVIERLKSDSNLRATVAGHSDSTGKPAAKQAYAQGRAWNVREYLRAHGAGRNQVLLSNEVLHTAEEEAGDPARMAANRRVEITLSPAAPKTSGL